MFVGKMFNKNTEVCSRKELGVNISSTEKAESELIDVSAEQDSALTSDVSSDESIKRPLSGTAGGSKDKAAPIYKIFIDDLTEQRHVWRVPWFIVNICLLQLFIYMIGPECFYQRLMFIPEQSTHEYWRFLTYMLLHSDIVHLLLNVCLQLLIAFCLESEQGHWRVACIYFAGGLSGSLAIAIIQPQLSLLGASAGVYALLTSHIPHLLKNFSLLPHRYLRIAALLILCMSDACFTTYHFVVNWNKNPRICLEAHIAGGLVGLCLGYLLYRRIKRSRGCRGCLGGV